MMQYGCYQTTCNVVGNQMTCQCNDVQNMIAIVTSSPFVYIIGGVVIICILLLLIDKYIL